MPRGLFGRLFMARMLNQANLPGNGLVFDLMSLTQTDNVLEVGFGGGDLLFRFADAVGAGMVDGLELSKPMLDRARKRVRREGLERRVQLHEGSVGALPFEDDRFDGACSVNTIYFWPDLRAGLRELARVLHPGGRLVLGFGSDTDMRRAGYEERGFSLYSSEQIEAGLETEGLEPCRLERLDQSRGVFFASVSRRRAWDSDDG